MKIIGVSGNSRIFRPGQGEDSTDRMLEVMGKTFGYETFDFNFEPTYFYQWRSWRRQVEIAKALCGIVDPGDVVEAFSAGCLLTARAMEMGAEFSVAIFERPAMSKYFTFPPHAFEDLYIVHCPHDEALQIGKRLWWHPFGSLGLDGYPGCPRDERIHNIPSSVHAHPNHNAAYWTSNLIPNAHRRHMWIQDSQARRQRRICRCNETQPVEIIE